MAQHALYLKKSQEPKMRTTYNSFDWFFHKFQFPFHADFVIFIEIIPWSLPSKFQFLPNLHPMGCECEEQKKNVMIDLEKLNC